MNLQLITFGEYFDQPILTPSKRVAGIRNITDFFFGAKRAKWRSWKRVFMLSLGYSRTFYTSTKVLFIDTITESPVANRFLATFNTDAE